MLVLIGLLFFLTLTSLVLLPYAIFIRNGFNRYKGSRAVTCPETHRQVAVTVDAVHAAVTEIQGHADFRLSDCTRWPERQKCNRDCLPEALRTEPYHEGEAPITSKRIYHGPVLLAAFAAWYIGAVWHSHYLFRTRWMTDLGLTSQQLKQIVGWYSPHLLSVAVCLLFAYGVAWLLALSHRKGVGYGILHSLMLWTAVGVATGFALGTISSDLLRIELTYTLLAAIVVGAIIGGLSGKLVAPEWMVHYGLPSETRLK